SLIDLLEKSLEPNYYFDQYRSVTNFLKGILKNSDAVNDQYFQGFVSDKFHLAVIGGEIVRLMISKDKRPSLLTEYHAEEGDAQVVEVDLQIKRDKNKKSWLRGMPKLDFNAYVTIE